MDANQLEQMKQIEEMKKQLLSKLLTREAWERLARIRAVNPQLAAQAELYLIQLFQAGKLNEAVSDDKLRDILKALTPEKGINIKRK